MRGNHLLAVWRDISLSGFCLLQNLADCTQSFRQENPVLLDSEVSQSAALVPTFAAASREAVPLVNI